MDARVGELEDLEQRLKAVEEKLAFLESAMIPGRASVISEEQLHFPKTPVTTAGEDQGIESAIGRIGLAWLGMIVLVFGIIFFTEYLNSKGSPLLSTIIGYICIGSIWLISLYLRKNNPSLYLMFGMTGLIIGFYITMRLHFFASAPLIHSPAPAIMLMLLVCGFTFYLSVARKIQGYGVLAIIFITITAVVSNISHLMLSLSSVAAAGALYYYYRNRWKTLLIFTIFFSYATFFLWMFSDPPVTHSMQLVTGGRSGYFYLLLTGAIFSFLPLLRDDDRSGDEFIITSVVINGILFTLLLALVTVSFLKDSYVILYGAITLSCLVYSFVLRERTKWNFASAFFALYGFMAMSISLFGLVGIPGVYPLLAIQSLIVVSMALWFRNRLIIVMNSLLFIIILLAFLTSPERTALSDFSFAITALVSARIINWKRERLEIKTELMRNLYLIAGFFMVMFALYHAVPRQFVALSWTCAALLYFGLSILLKNVKYRYMALGTMISAAFYLFIVDLARIEVIYRVMALIFLAVVSIGISIYYSNKARKTE